MWPSSRAARRSVGPGVPPSRPLVPALSYGLGAAGLLAAVLAAQAAGAGTLWVALCTMGVAGLTAAVAYAAERRAAKRRAATLARAAGGILHDLKGPLTVVLANAEFMADASRDGAERMACLQDVRDAVRQMQDTLQDLFDFIERGSQWTPRLVDACGVVEDEARRVASATGGNAVHVVCDVRSGITVRTDERWFRRAIRNLVANALQANATIISLVGDCDGQAVRLTVSDDGKGMPREVCARAFEPFHTHGKPHGTGLGMTVARDVARRSGGTVSCQSVQGQGTQVTLTLPCPGVGECGALR